MSTKKVAALIVAALVAGVVLGSFGIANAGNGVQPAATAACDPAACDMESGAACDPASGACPTPAQQGAAANTACDPAAGECDMSSGACVPNAGAAPRAGCPDCQ